MKMTIGDVVRILYKRIPNSETWTKGELYGLIGPQEELDYYVTKVAYCVTTPSQEGMHWLIANGYDLLIAHHPINLSDAIPTLVFHTSLDCCDGGLNDQWRDALGMTNTRHFDKNLGWYGHIMPKTLDQLTEQIECWLGHKIQGQIFGPKDELIKSVAVCSGLGGLVNGAALKTKVDCYIVGEAVGPAEKSGFKFYVETGHSISERMGVKVIQAALEPHGLQVDLLPIEFEGWKREVYKSNMLTGRRAVVKIGDQTFPIVDGLDYKVGYEEDK
jgi:putative NIF3 family GTP cyclohydrolase 1 type 2